MNDPDAPTRTSRKGAIVLGGSHGSLAIARSLGRRGIPVWSITADNPLASLSRYVERSFRWPGPRDERALKFLLELGHREALASWVLFVGDDETLRFVAQNHVELGAMFTLTTLAWDKARWTCDKRCMNALATELGIACPHTRYPQSANDLATLDVPFPLILKPAMREDRNEFVDAKAWRVDDRHTLVERYKKAKSLIGADNVMLQELIPGDGTTQFSYAALWDGGRPIASLVAQRRRQYPIEFGFASTFVQTMDQPQIEKYASLFLASLMFSGLVEIEFKYDARDGAFKLLDVNARAWTWIALGAAAGIDLPALQWRLATGETIVPQKALRGVRWLYFSHDLAAGIGEILAGRLSPLSYLRSLRRPFTFAVFAWDDPLPGLLDLPLSASRVAARWFQRHGHQLLRASTRPKSRVEWPA